MKKIIDYLLGLPKSIYINFRLCCLKDAWQLPIIVSRKVSCVSLRGGRASFDKVRTGIVRIGFGSVETVDFHHERTLLYIKGQLHFAGKAKIGKGTRLSITGAAFFGENFHISAASKIICREKIQFGNNVLISWDTLITDTDHHAIFSAHSSQPINKNKAVTIGDTCWIGSKACILKGVTLADNTIVGCSSVVTKSVSEANTCIAGNPAKILKHNLHWQE